MGESREGIVWFPEMSENVRTGLGPVTFVLSQLRAIRRSPIPLQTFREPFTVPVPRMSKWQ